VIENITSPIIQSKTPISMNGKNYNIYTILFNHVLQSIITNGIKGKKNRF